MTRLILCIAFIGLLNPSLLAEEEAFWPHGLSDANVPFHSARGRDLFADSKSKTAFWYLAENYATQQDLGSCGAASSAMVLNSLHIPRPPSQHHRIAHDNYRLFTQSNLFTPDVERVVTAQKVSSSGMTLDQLARVFAAFPVDVTMHFAVSEKQEYADAMTVDEFRAILDAALRKEKCFVVVNYQRSAVAQNEGGHISCVGAFNKGKGTDFVLLLDTANYKYPWVWVDVDRLWRAMSESVDSESKRPRGFLIVSSRNTSRASK